jgi:hypothetical protein
MFFFNDHDPPHFHVDCGDFRAKVSIATLKIIDGALPANKRRAKVGERASRRAIGGLEGRSK